MSTFDILQILVEESALKKNQIMQTVSLLEEGATVPFIARYRKELTGELDEVQIRQLQERFSYFKELNERRQTILKSIKEQGKLTAELQHKIFDCRKKTELEDLYLPYKPKRRTKATIAKEQGLEPLAEILLQAIDPAAELELLATPFVNPEMDILTTETALQGAGHILAEQFSDNARARSKVREITWQQGLFHSQPARGQAGTLSKYEMYYDFSEPLRQIPSHRMLAMRRGEKESVLRLSVEAPEEEILSYLAQLLIPKNNPYYDWLKTIIDDTYLRLLAPSIEVELRLKAKQAADTEAIRVFSENLRNLLLAAPAGNFRVLGVDPGLRTGSKLAVVDQTGRFLDHATIYPHTGRGRIEEAQQTLLNLIEKHRVEMVAIGNGTAGREMEQFVKQCLKSTEARLPVTMVSEAGASVYSASDIAREEFPDLDLTVRGAISIARRLQDPLAELVKVDPKSIGVGQYQHDVSQTALKKALGEVIESCVNYVGVDLNTTSWALLSFVSGISESLAKLIVSYRDENGEFKQRKQLLKVPRFGQKAFEQAAGFLRIRAAEYLLDNTAVHPERYQLVQQMATDAGVDLRTLVADPALLDAINLNRYVTTDVGLPTLHDIISELKKPGRDPRETFVSTSFREDVTEIKDIREGMVLNGAITNVAAFGAFVDIGVHQDGLVHISQLADRFVKDPNDVVKVGQQVQVRVLKLDLARRRISLTMKAAGENQKDKKPDRTKIKIKTGQTQDTRGGLAAALEKSRFRVKQRK